MNSILPIETVEGNHLQQKMEGLFPAMSASIVNKVLLIEVYFLLRSGKSPAYFSLIDLVDSYSIELFYITVSLWILSGWFIVFGLAGYVAVVGTLTWLVRKILNLFRYEGIPIFAALHSHNVENSVSVQVAKDYSMSNAVADLKLRIHDYEKSSQEQLAGEAMAATNFVMILLMVWISHATGAPNFLIKITSFADPILFGNAYKVCVVVLVLQGLIGRVSQFHLLRDSGSLPPNFFKSEIERTAVAAWAAEMSNRYIPLAAKWMTKGKDD